MEISRTSRAAVPVIVRTPFCSRAVAPVAALAGAADAPSRPAIAAVTAALAARRMRVFICFSYVQKAGLATGSPCSTRAAVELAPGGLRVRDLGETASASRPAECAALYSR